MSAPALQVYVTGSGTVTGDMLNTFVSSCDDMAQLRAFVGIQGIQVFVRGTSAPGDGGAGNFYWNANGTAPDDNGVTTVVPYGAGSGEWTRLTGKGFASNTLSSNQAGTTSTTQVMYGLNVQFTPALTGTVLIIVTGGIVNSNPSDGGGVTLNYGTGTPPVNGAASTGTGISHGAGSGALPESLPFSVSGVVSGLGVGTVYWVDLAFVAITGGTATISDVTVSIVEV